MRFLTKRFRRRERAQGMVEFALALPVLLLLLMGAIEVGRMLFIYSAVATASREAARYGSAVGGNTTGVPRYRDCNGIRSAAVRVGGLAGVENSSAGVDIQYDDGDVDGDGSPVNKGVCPVNGSGPALDSLGDRLRVTVQAEYRPIVPLVPLKAFTIQSVSARTVIKDISVGAAIVPVVSKKEVHIVPPSKEVLEDDPSTIEIAVMLTGVFPENVVVPFNVNSSTATQGQDFTISSSPVTIPPGSTNATISIQILDDPYNEADETVVITLETPFNADLGSQTVHTLTIKDNDPQPEVSFGVALDSKDEGAGNVSVEVRLSQISGKNVTVPFTVQSSSTAAPVDDYTISSSPVTIPAGSLSAYISVGIVDDNLVEDDEWIDLEISSPVNATLAAPGAHQLRITENDTAVISFAIASQEVAEAVGSLAVEIQVSKLSTKVITLPFTVSGSAMASSDYEMPTANPIQIPAGAVNASIQVDILPDGIPEDDETVVLTLGAPTPAGSTILGTQSSHTITINSHPTVWFSPAGLTVPENAGSLTLEVKIDPVLAAKTVTVPFSVSGTATPGQDFTISSSPVTISPGSSSALIAIDVIDDTRYENEETLIVTMGNPGNAAKGAPDVYTLTITSDDPLPTASLSPAGATAKETPAGSAITVTVQLSAASILDVTVPFTVTGTASLGSDYTITASPVSIPAGQLSANILITINDDALREEDETVIVAMGEPVNAIQGNSREHTTTIKDDDILCWIDSSAELMVVKGLKPNDQGSISWRITNLGQNMLYLGQATLAWMGDISVPGQTPYLSNAYSDSQQIWSGSKAPPSSSITMGEWSVNTLTLRQLGPNPAARTFKFLFSRPLIDGSHSVTLTFYYLDGSTPVNCAPVNKTYTVTP